MRKSGLTISHKDQPDWYEDLSRPPFRTFGNDQANLVLTKVREQDRFGRKSSLQKRWRMVTFGILIAIIGGVAWVASDNLRSEGRAPSANVTTDGKWQTYSAMDASFEIPAGWEVVRTNETRLDFISDRGGLGSMTVLPYGLVFSRSFEGYYPPNSKLVDEEPEQTSATKGSPTDSPVLIGPPAKHMRFQLYTTEGEPWIIEDHYYFMQAVVTYDFAFRSDWIDQSTLQRIAQSFLFTGKLPDKPCGRTAICDTPTETP
jgi:hypothetical protein